MRFMRSHSRCVPSTQLFEVSRELHHHGENDHVPYDRTLYFHARRSFSKHLEELGATPDFSFLQDATVYAGRPRIVTSYDHEVHKYSQGSQPNRLRGLRDKLEEFYPDRKRRKPFRNPQQKNIWLGTTAFSKLVVTHINSDPAASLFTLQPSRHTLQGGDLNQLMTERRRQGEIMGAPQMAERMFTDEELNVGIPISRLSLGHMYRDAQNTPESTVRQDQNRLLAIASITLAELVNSDLDKTFHPSSGNHFVSYAADEPGYIDSPSMIQEDFTIPGPRIHELAPGTYGLPPSTRQKVIF